MQSAEHLFNKLNTLNINANMVAKECGVNAVTLEGWRTNGIPNDYIKPLNAVLNYFEVISQGNVAPGTEKLMHGSLLMTDNVSEMIAKAEANGLNLMMISTICNVSVAVVMRWKSVGRAKISVVAPLIAKLQKLEHSQIAPLAKPQLPTFLKQPAPQHVPKLAPKVKLNNPSNFTTSSADFTLEDLARKAIELGYVANFTKMID